MVYILHYTYMERKAEVKDMMTIICLLVLAGVLGVGAIFGWALIVTAFWFLVKLPVAVVIFVVGVLLCCTIFLIPVGLACIKASFRVLV